VTPKPFAFHYLTIEDVIEIHERLIVDQGDDSKGILSPSNLQICLVSPYHRMFGIEPYDDLFKKGAKLAYEIVCLHPFIDGNKRTAFTAVSILLEMNGYSVKAEKYEIVSIMLSVAKGEIDYQALLSFIEVHSHPKDR